MADRHADSAGIPFTGRQFQPNPAANDDGSAPARLIEAIQRFRAGELGVADVVAALHHERVLVPLIAEAGDVGVGPYGQKVDKTQELSVVTVAGPDGRAVLPAFTSVAAMQAWNAQARPVPIQASKVALGAAGEGTQLLIIDPGSDTQFAVRAPAFKALATGEAWVPSFDDVEVAQIVAASVADEPAVTAVGIAPGDPQARLTGAELLVVLQLAQGTDEGARAALLTRVQERWASDATLGERVDSIAVRVASA